MDTQEIFASLKTNEITKDCFFNVYPIDKLPAKNTVKYNEKGESFLVINLDPSYKGGSHWIALCISPSEYCADEYFDSYGRKPPKIIKNYLDGNYINQKKQLQSHFSTVCGQWCIFYILKRCEGLSLLDITSLFSKSNPQQNDFFC